MPTASLQADVPSYSTGFYPRDGQPKYPSLWEGRTNAWGIFLGRTGLDLWDWGSDPQHGTLSAGDLFWNDETYRHIESNRGRIDLGSKLSSFVTNRPWSLHTRFRHLSFIYSSYPMYLTQKSDVVQNFKTFMSNVGTYADFSWGSQSGVFGNYRVELGVSGLGPWPWREVAVTYNGRGATDIANYRAYVDGYRRQVLESGGFAADSLNASMFAQAGTTSYDSQMRIAEVNAWNRELVPSEVALLRRAGPGGSYARERRLYFPLFDVVSPIKTLRGTSTVQHDAAGTLTVVAAPGVKPLQGTSTVQHDAAGTLTVIPPAVQTLQGTSTVQHDAAGTLTVLLPAVLPLQGTSTVQHDASATMRIPVPGVQPLRGTSTVQHDATGTLSKIQRLSGSSDVAHDARGTLTVLGGVKLLRGTADVQHDALGRISVPIRRLSGITTVQHNARGTISGATTPAADGQAWTAPHTSAEWHAPQTSAIWTF